MEAALQYVVLIFVLLDDDLNDLDDDLFDDDFDPEKHLPDDQFDVLLDRHCLYEDNDGLKAELED